MAIRKILVSVDGSEVGRGALETAVMVAREHGAHIDALHVRPDPRLGVPLMGEGVSATMVEELVKLTEEESAARAVRAKSLFNEVQRDRGLTLGGDPGSAGASISWAQSDGREEEEIARRGRLSDIIVLGRPSMRPDSDATVIFNAALFETGRPVLVAAARAGGTIGRHVAVAWNGSIEAARAIAAAMDVLLRAETVEVIVVDPNADTDLGLADVVDYLAWHGVGARQRMAAPAKNVTDTLVGAIGNADLVVMGAYSHSRLRELILGGVTRHMLENTDVALLMAH